MNGNNYITDQCNDEQFNVYI